MAVAELDLDLDLDVFAGPFDLLMAVVLREEVSLLDLQLGEVVVAYVEHLEREGELELEVATEFLVLIAALLELKSRLMLPGPEEELDEMEPEEAVEELIARMLEYRRYRDASAELAERFEAQRGYLYRSAPLPPELRRVAVEAASAVYDPDQLGTALGDLLTEPEDVDISHIRPTVSLERRLRALRDALLRRKDFDFDEEFGGEDRLTQAVTVFAMLELYRKGEVTWEQGECFGPIRVQEGGADRSQQGRVSDLSRTVEALLFLSPQPVSVADLAEATEATEGQVEEAIELLREDLAEGKRGVVLREVSGGFSLASDPGQRGGGAAPAGEAADAAADPGPGRDAGDRRLPAAGLAAGDRPHPRRQLRVGGDQPRRARPDRRVGPLPLRRRDLQDDRAVRAPLRPQRPRPAARPLASSTRARRTSASCASGC